MSEPTKTPKSEPAAPVPPPAPSEPAGEPAEPRPRHPDPTRYGDWEIGGRCIDF